MKSAVLAGLVACFAAGDLAAATFAGSSEGSFWSKNIGASTNSCRFDAYGNGANSGVAWGDPDPCPDVNGVAQYDSHLWFVDTAFSQNTTGQEDVLIGEMRWFNDANSAASNFAAIGDWTLSITDPVGVTYTEAIAFNIKNTLNPTADHIIAMTFENFGQMLPIVLGDLVLDSFSLGLLSDNGGDEDLLVREKPDGDLQFKWINPEHAVSSIGLYAKVAVVPLPAAGWMLLLGIGAGDQAQKVGLIAFRRAGPPIRFW